MNAVALIPARYASSRFPGKALIDLGGKTMIQRVYERAASVALFSEVIVATDDERICSAVRAFGGKAVITSTAHRSGTDRCAEVVRTLDTVPEVVVNVQGDEPFLAPAQLELLTECFRDPATQIATLVKKISDTETLENPNTPKVVQDTRGRAIYFSRHPIPYQRGVEVSGWLDHVDYYKHIGVYGYRTDVLLEIVKLPMGRLEQAESLEQLRWLENGYTIQIAETTAESVAIDTPEDLARVRRMMETGEYQD